MSFPNAGRQATCLRRVPTSRMSSHTSVFSSSVGAPPSPHKPSLPKKYGGPKIFPLQIHLPSFSELFWWPPETKKTNNFFRVESQTWRKTVVQVFLRPLKYWYWWRYIFMLAVKHWPPNAGRMHTQSVSHRHIVAPRVESATGIKRDIWHCYCVTQQVTQNVAEHVRRWNMNDFFIVGVLYF